MKGSRQNTSQTDSDAALPLRCGIDSEFARVESLLRSSGFDQATVCRVFRVTSLSDINSIDSEEIVARLPDSPVLALLINAFLLSAPIPRLEAERLIDRQSLDAMIALDLLRPGSDGPTARECVEAYFSPVLLYPVAGLLIASDRRSNPDGSPYVTPRDAVFPGIHPGTLDFLRIVSKRPADTALDLGAGSGIGAILLSKYVNKVVAADITPRTAHFTRFNQLLNRCENLEIVQGDLYAPVEGRTFDRIIAHPPYQPSTSKEPVLYRDAGKAGEEILERIVRGLAAHLNPGGDFYCVSAAWDTTNHAFEERLRGWLGESAEEFDSIFATGDEKPLHRYAADLAEQADGESYLSGSGISGRSRASREKFMYGAIFVRRRETGYHQRYRGIQPLNARERLSSVTDGASFEWAVRWHRWCAEHEMSGDLHEAISELRPRFGAGLQVRVTYTVQGGALLPSDVVLESGRPFLAITRVDQWVVPVMGLFDGHKAVREVYRMAMETSMLPEQCRLNDFSSLAGKLIKCGYLDCDQI